MAGGRVISDSGVYQKTTLKNGLRIVTEKMSSVRSVSLGVWIDVGSRNERPGESGVSHFIEHMLFKGTRKRTARQIASALESLGGSLNAFTSREYSCYAARILDEHLKTAIDVLADMTCHSTLTPLNLKREKMVICEEIKEIADTPADHIHDVFAETFWGSHPLGRPILGTKQTVTDMKRARVVDYLRRYYRSESVVITAAGCISHRKLVRLVKEQFDFPIGQAGTAEAARRDKEKSVRLEPNNNIQTHLCLGYPGLQFADDDKMAALALNVYLGGGMSSVLFQKIREEHGLAYSVYTFHDFYRDAGLFGAYLGTDQKHLRQAVDIVLTELDRMKKQRLPSAKLDRIKGQMKGQLALGMESTSSRMNRLARQELMLLPYKSYKHILKEVEKVTSSQILKLSNRLFDHSRMAIAVLGPADKGVFDGVF
jgi:predicted Zn-dependent peptidase